MDHCHWWITQKLLFGSRHPLSAVSLGLRDTLWPEIFKNLAVGLTFNALQNSQQLFFGIWSLTWNMTPRSNTFVLFLKKSRVIQDMIIFFSINLRETHFVKIFFCNLRKSPEVILGHLGVYGVKFRTSPKADKLYLKMKLLK